MATVEYWKKSFLKNEKVAKSRKSRKCRKYYTGFFCFQVFILSYSQNRKVAFESLVKKFLSLQRFPSFRPGMFQSPIKVSKENHNYLLNAIYENYYYPNNVLYILINLQNICCCIFCNIQYKTHYITCNVKEKNLYFWTYV